MSGFTKGKWNIAVGTENEPLWIENEAEEPIAAVYVSDSITPEKQKANARLIAAAPVGYQLGLDVIAYFEHCRCDSMVPSSRPCLACQAEAFVQLSTLRPMDKAKGGGQ